MAKDRDRDKRITFCVAPEGSYYEGTILRVVTRVIGGQKVETSSTSTGMTMAEFQERHPEIPIGGMSVESLHEQIKLMTDEQLAKLGLSRQEGVTQTLPRVREPEPTEPTFHYPKLRGFGSWETSDGEVFSKEGGGKEAAKEHEDAIEKQALLDEQIREARGSQEPVANIEVPIFKAPPELPNPTAGMGDPIGPEDEDAFDNEGTDWDTIEGAVDESEEMEAAKELEAENLQGPTEDEVEHEPVPVMPKPKPKAKAKPRKRAPRKTKKG